MGRSLLRAFHLSPGILNSIIPSPVALNRASNCNGTSPFSPRRIGPHHRSSQAGSFRRTSVASIFRISVSFSGANGSGHRRSKRSWNGGDPLGLRGHRAPNHRLPADAPHAKGYTILRPKPWSPTYLTI